MTNWSLEIGKSVSRTSLHEKYGGSASRGISVPARGSTQTNIMLFWKPQHGEQWGYQDGWTKNGSRFYFTGMGQTGDQTFAGHTTENGRLRDHRNDGMSVRLLRALQTNFVSYEAQLQLVDFFFLSSTDGLGNPRQVIQFEFEPIGEFIQFGEGVKSDAFREKAAPASLLRPDDFGPQPAKIERVAARQFEHIRQQVVVQVRRLEAALVSDFAAWMEGRGVAVGARMIPYAPERRMLRVDAYIEGAPPILIEAKASVSRENIRMAIGQALDYARYERDAAIAVLLPTEPPEDMKQLIQSTQHMPFVSAAGVVWKSGDEFCFTGLNMNAYWPE